MRLDYKILWIDNDDAIYTDHEDVIIRHLEDLGFNPIISKGRDYSAFDGFSSVLREFDLFVLDYRLNGDKNGNEIIKDIRNTHSIYTDVIFYSAVKDDLRQKIYDDRLNGVYYTGRGFEEFEEDVLSLIDVTIRKTQDINNLRGLIMAEVAELYIMKEEIIHKASQKISNKELEKYTLEKIKSSGESNHKKAQTHLNNIDAVTFASLFEKIGFVDSNKKARTLGEALDKLNITEPVTKETFTEPYIENILKKRNKFAHIKECDGQDSSGKPCKVIGGIPFTPEHCIQIRKDIKKYKQLLQEIERKLDE